MSGLLLELRSRWQAREWPRFREGAIKDEHQWIASLDDRELARLAAGLYGVEKAVKSFEKANEKPNKDAA